MYNDNPARVLSQGQPWLQGHLVSLRTARVIWVPVFKNKQTKTTKKKEKLSKMSTYSLNHLLLWSVSDGINIILSSFGSGLFLVLENWVQSLTHAKHILNIELRFLYLCALPRRNPTVETPWQLLFTWQWQHSMLNAEWSFYYKDPTYVWERQWRC